MSIQYVSIATLPDIALSSINSNSNFQNSKTVVEVLSTYTVTDPITGTDETVSKYTTQSMTLGSLISGLYEKGGLREIIKKNYGLEGGSNLSAAWDFTKTLSNNIQNTNNGINFKENGLKLNSSPVISKATLNDALLSCNNNPLIKSGSSFYTKYKSLEKSTSIEIRNDINEAPSTNDDKHNRYIFKVSQHTSDIYVCPVGGWFVCYGWLSEKENYTPRSGNNPGEGRQDNSKRWAALEAKIGNNWRIIQLQSVPAGSYCNYVGFSVPVANGLNLRVTTGFDVGKTSGQYSNTPGSLTNHIPNAFIGGVYV